MKLLDELIEAILCGFVFLLTMFLFYDPAALQDQWEWILKRLKCLFVLSFRFSDVALRIHRCLSKILKSNIKSV